MTGPVVPTVPPAGAPAGAAFGLGVAAVIPAFNAAQTIASAIESVLAQSVPCHEIVVVDDGSTDGMAELVTRRYPSVKLVVQSNQGAAAARNRGVTESSAPLVAFLDADDLWHPRKIELQARALTNHPDAVASCTGYFFIEADQQQVTWDITGRTGEQLLALDGVFADPYLGTPTVMVRRSVFTELGGFNTALQTAEDIDLWLRLGERGFICRLAAPLAAVRPLPGSLSRRAGDGDGRNLQVFESFLLRNPQFRVTHGALVRRVRSDVLCRIGSGHLTRGELGRARRLLSAAVGEDLLNTRAWYLLMKSIGLMFLRLPLAG